MDLFKAIRDYIYKAVRMTSGMKVLLLDDETVRFLLIFCLLNKIKIYLLILTIKIIFNINILFIRLL